MLYPPSESNTSIPYGSNGHRLVPSIRLEMMRDGLEDYEYLYCSRGGQPAVGQANTADPQADKIISGLTSYTRDSEFLYNLRRLIGLKNGGEIAAIPDIQPPPRTHAPWARRETITSISRTRPESRPRTPLVVNGKTYLKIGAGRLQPGRRVRLVQPTRRPLADPVAGRSAQSPAGQHPLFGLGPSGHVGIRSAQR